MTQSGDPPDRKPTNTRAEKGRGERNHLILVLFTLIVVGSLLIAAIFGPQAALTALPCLLGGGAIVMISWLLLTVIEKLRNRMEQC